MELKLFNTLSREKERFQPAAGNLVRMYACGLTVYGRAHIGNLRTYIFNDILNRTLRYNGYELDYVQNITDVGHLVGDENDGEDKMEVGAREYGKSMWQIADEFIALYKTDCEKLHILPPKFVRATEHIKEQIGMIQTMEAKGFTYPTSDGIYFDSAKLPDYGKLARLDVSGLREGARVQKNPERRNLTDFVLWKFSPEGKQREMEWESPWGTGSPGWHIECSAMSTSYLGTTIDIHTGGIDHIPVHHTNEIAQNEATFGTDVVRFWLHGEFITVDGKKMSKSLKNVYSLADIEAKGFSPLDYRFFVFSAHYRSQLNFTWDALRNAALGYGRIRDKMKEFAAHTSSNATFDATWEQKFHTAVNDDLNLPQAIAVLWEMLRDEELPPATKLATALHFDSVLGLGLAETLQEESTPLPTAIQRLLEARETARRSKDWTEADRLRVEIEDNGYYVKDTEAGSIVSKR